MLALLITFDFAAQDTTKRSNSVADMATFLYYRCLKYSTLRKSEQIFMNNNSARIKQYAPIALAMDEFFQKLQNESKSTPYPATQLEKLLITNSSKALKDHDRIFMRKDVSWKHSKKMVRSAGLEPPTPWFEAR